MPRTVFSFRIARGDGTRDAVTRFQDYSVELPAGATVLEALLHIRREIDGTLAFRSACRGAVCGSCAMRINGRIDLACRAQVYTLGSRQITIEPLPGLRVRKDLIVDMDPFFEKLHAAEPWLQPTDPQPDRERLVLPEQAEEAEPYTRCVQCACCQSVCPAAARDPTYLGPAALAKQYRFLADPRDGAVEGRLAAVDSQSGVWGCDMVRNCVKICPKGVPPTSGIGKMRAHLRRAGQGS